MEKVIIEWQHLDVDGETCDRCNDTGETLRTLIHELQSSEKLKEVDIKLVETKLTGEDVSESNSVLINGKSIEELLDVEIADNLCDSCSELLSKETYCRTVTFEGLQYEDIPAKAIRQGIFKVLGIKDDAVDFNIISSSCDSKNGCC